MKYITYLIFACFIGALLLLLKNALQPSQEPIVITGSEKCGECHQLKVLGDQQSVWENSRHAEAYRILQSQQATDFAVKNNIEQPVKNEKCLKCHTTEIFLGENYKSPTYNIEEGVGCESCHGAGSEYSPADIMKDEALFKRNGGIVGDELTCLKCHSPKGNKEKKLMENVCPFQTEDFVYKTSWERIKHPVNRDSFK